MSDVTGLNNSLAWVLSIILLVITIRAILAPFTWSLYKSGRTSMLMRPERAALTEKYAEVTTPEQAKEEQDALNELNKRYEYRPLAGCIPPLIQLPVIIGLLTLLRWMAIPDERHESGIGLLSPADIMSFREAKFLGAPLTSFLSMPDQEFAALGTTEAEVRAVFIPLMVFAIIFTTANLAISAARSTKQLDWSMKAARVVNQFQIILTVIMPFMILFLGLSGVLPIALMLYWVTNNLWTAVQTAVFWAASVKKIPLDDVHRAHNAAEKEKAQTEIRAKRLAKRNQRRRRLSAMTRPSDLKAINQEIAAEKEAQAAAKQEEKARKKALNKQRTQARVAMRQQERLEKKQAKEAAEGPAEESAEESGREEQTD
ncbi:membrane protein insertase YidC [Corynebacterium lubricantis]|uniref:membrane protein insertase YidC n=1 Tax=Corynebacterium lubricantis TaxID=541095 RepID=UPI001FE02BA8|nr:membrane protein insertase YidC [Corynebacterium lubricantis]